MIGVRKENRPFLRFLWPNAEGRIVVWRLTELLFGVNCSPFVLYVVLFLHFSEQERVSDSPEILELI